MTFYATIRVVERLKLDINSLLFYVTDKAASQSGNYTYNLYELFAKIKVILLKKLILYF